MNEDNQIEVIQDISTAKELIEQARILLIKTSVPNKLIKELKDIALDLGEEISELD